MYEIKSYQDDQEWIRKREGVMEELLQYKLEQDLAFKEALKHLANLMLVENTWNWFWGSGCPWVSDAIWFKQFKGQNRLGKLLEKSGTWSKTETPSKTEFIEELSIPYYLCKVNQEISEMIQVVVISDFRAHDLVKN